MRRRERVLQSVRMREHGVEAGAGDELEGRHALAEQLAQAAEQLDGGARAVERDPGGRRGARSGDEPQDGGGDDAERSLGAEERAA
jgi:hypothetical protein